MDPLSEILVILKPQSHLSAGLDAGGDWALRFGAPEGIKFNAVVKGSGWVSVEGAPGWQRIEEGDCFLLPLGRPFFLASDPALEAVDSAPLYEAARGGIAVCNQGGDFFLLGGRFSFAGDLALRLFGALPAVVVVPRSLDQASVLRWALDRLAWEVAHREPGGSLMAEYLAHMMLVQVLRLIAATPGSRAGWLAALADPQLGRVLSALHADPGHPWTLAEMAGLAAMSRSLFAQRFRETVGSAPLAYLTRWRMHLAAERLLHSSDRISDIAHSLGYDSESAFSTAFKRVLLRSPRDVRDGPKGR